LIKIKKKRKKKEIITLWEELKMFEWNHTWVGSACKYHSFSRQHHYLSIQNPLCYLFYFNFLLLFYLFFRMFCKLMSNRKKKKKEIHFFVYYEFQFDQKGLNVISNSFSFFFDWLFVWSHLNIYYFIFCDVLNYFNNFLVWKFSCYE